jgi:hypothetical protein
VPVQWQDRRHVPWLRDRPRGSTQARRRGCCGQYAVAYEGESEAKDKVELDVVAGSRDAFGPISGISGSVSSSRLASGQFFNPAPAVA